jgi:hypothetical protein
VPTRLTNQIVARQRACRRERIELPMLASTAEERREQRKGDPPGTAEALAHIAPTIARGSAFGARGKVTKLHSLKIVSRQRPFFARVGRAQVAGKRPQERTPDETRERTDQTKIPPEPVPRTSVSRLDAHLELNMGLLLATWQDSDGPGYLDETRLRERRIFIRVGYVHEWDLETPHLPDRGDRHLIRRIVNEDLKTGALLCGSQVIYADRRGTPMTCVATCHASHREQRTNRQRLRKRAVAHTLPDASRWRGQIDAVDLGQMRSGNEPVERGQG